MSKENDTYLHVLSFVNIYHCHRTALNPLVIVVTIVIPCISFSIFIPIYTLPLVVYRHYFPGTSHRRYPVLTNDLS